MLASLQGDDARGTCHGVICGCKNVWISQILATLCVDRTGLITCRYMAKNKAKLNTAIPHILRHFSIFDCLQISLSKTAPFVGGHMEWRNLANVPSCLYACVYICNLRM